MVNNYTDNSHPIDAYFDDTVQTISKILTFDSSLAPAEENCPFGKGSADCLQYFLDLAEKMGFETHNYDNYVGEVVFGEGEEFAILAHLDVVPAGSGWTYPPFSGVINDEVSAGGVKGKKIWGRGAMDDKGPAVSCLYALYALKQSGFVPKRKIKFILGCNEECGWKCIEHYKKVAKLPEEGFTPDADFPAIYAEKGILHIATHFNLNNPPFTSLSAGERVNMVCDNVVCTIPRKTANALVGHKTSVAGTDFYYDNTTNTLRFTGKSSHACGPSAGANALDSALAFFKQFDDEINRAYAFLFEDVSALKTLKDETGMLTMSPDLAEYKNGVLTITTDIRFPATMQKEDILKRFDDWNLDYEIVNYQAPLFNDPNSHLISTLTSVYNSVCGTDVKPISIGGGTYARALKRGCAFGPESASDEPVIHQCNEYITFDKIRLINRIYFDAIKALCK